MPKKTATDTSQEKAPNPVNAGLTETFLGCERAIKRFLTRFLYRPEDVDEIAQETFLVAYDANQKREIHSPKAYLFQVAKSIALRELTRKSSKMTNYLEDALAQDEHLLDGNSTLEDQVIAQQKLADYCNAISDMPPQCRKVFLMRKLQAKSHVEIAEALNISRSMVEKHIANGVKKFDSYMLERESPAGTKVTKDVPSGSESRRLT